MSKWSIKQGIKQILGRTSADANEPLFSVDETPVLGEPLRSAVKGWALDPHRKAVRLELYLDGVLIRAYPCVYPRRDVRSVFPNHPYSLTSGFVVELSDRILERVESSRLELFVVFSGHREKIWEWEGSPYPNVERALIEGSDTLVSGVEITREDEGQTVEFLGWLTIGELKAGLVERNRYSYTEPVAYGPEGVSFPTSVSIIVDGYHGVDATRRTLESLPKQIERLKAAELADVSVSVLTAKTSLDHFETLKQDLKRTISIQLIAREDFLGWGSLQANESEDPRQRLVLYSQAGADLSLADLGKLARDYVEHPSVSVLMCTPYGASSGMVGPLGRHLADLQNTAEPALLFALERLGPVWVTGLDFLLSLEPTHFKQTLKSSEARLTGTERVILPPDTDAFMYHLDLRQPVLSTPEFASPGRFNERFFIHQTLLECYPFQIGQRPGKPTVIFVSTSDDSKQDRLETTRLAQSLREQGHEVVYVLDSDDPAGNSIGGFVPLPLHSFPNCGGNAGSGWIIPTSAEAVRAAFTLRYLTGFKVAQHISNLEWRQYRENECEKLDLARWASVAEAVTFTSELVGENSFIKQLEKNHEKWTKEVSKARVAKNLSIVLPVYCALDAVIACVRSLLDRIPEGAEVIIVNDASDSETSRWLKQLSLNHPEITLIEQETNGGFIEACYAGFEAANDENDILLLNSDVVLTEHSLNNVRRAAYSSPHIGLVSPLSTGSPHLQITLNPGDTLEHAARTIVDIHSPNYPTVITPEGQCLYIRRWALEKFGFFDRVFGRGFCEESDMCMRMFLSGVEMVCADDALIFHRRSASFSSKVRHKLYNENRPIFDSRWARYFDKIYESFRARDIVGGVRRSYAALAPRLEEPPGPFALEEIEKCLDESRELRSSNVRTCKRAHILQDAQVVFVLSAIRRGGGALSVLQHVNELNMRGISAQVISLKEAKDFDYPLITGHAAVSLDQLYELDWTNQNVIATYWFTSYVVNELVKRNPNLQGFYYVQDYEPWFYPRPSRFLTVQQAEKSYELGLQCVAKTQFLVDLLKQRHSVDAHLITPGLCRSVFYPGDQDQYHGRPRFTALLRTNTPRRGYQELLKILQNLRLRVPELKIQLFGDLQGIPEDLERQVDLLGGLPQDRVGKLYRESDILVDLSHWHGFGRMGIESMACGIVPVLSKSGGVDRYATHAQNCFMVDVGDDRAATEAVIRLAKDRELRLKMRENALATAARFSEERATDDWLSILKVEGSSGGYPSLHIPGEPHSVNTTRLAAVGE